MQQVFCVCSQVVDKWGVEVIECDVPVSVQEPAVEEVEDGEDYNGAGVGGVEDGWQGREFSEDAFPERVCEASVGEGGVSGVDAKVGTEDDRAKPVDPG